VSIIRDIATISRFTRDVLRTPHPDKDEAGLIEVLLEASRRHPDFLLVPAADSALGPIARHKLVLEDAGLNVATMDDEVTDALLNKVKTFAQARSAGVPSPATYAPENEPSPFSARRTQIYRNLSVS
jgi:predicted ATP-grasp superfamily ATP-dependent carboligase